MKGLTLEGSCIYRHLEKTKEKEKNKETFLERKFQIWLSCAAVDSKRFGVGLVCTITIFVLGRHIQLTKHQKERTARTAMSKNVQLLASQLPDKRILSTQLPSLRQLILNGVFNLTISMQLRCLSTFKFIFDRPKYMIQMSRFWR